MTSSRHHARIAQALLAVVLMASSALALPGDLDTSFGDGGFVLTPVAAGRSTDSGVGVAIQADGRILVATQVGSPQDFVVARFDSVGVLDEAFGTDGFAVAGFNVNWSDSIEAMAVQPDGKIVAVGGTESGNGSAEDIALARFDADGFLDPTFDGDGLQTTAIAGVEAKALAVAVQPDGKIVVGGQVRLPSAYTDMLVARYDSTGTLDPSFGTGGITTMSLGTAWDHVHALAIQPDGKLVAVAEVRNLDDWDDRAFTLLRFEIDGTLDGSFGSGGIAVHDVGDDADILHDVALQPDGKMIAVGRSGPEFLHELAVMRFDANGVLDPGFGTGGLVLSDFGFPRARAGAVSLRHDGAIVIAGQAGDRILVAQYASDGSLDPSFSGDGWEAVLGGPGPSLPQAVGLQPDGKIVVTGRLYEGFFDSTLGVVRFEAGLGLCGNGTVDPGEVCDDAGASATCDTDCSTAACGDAQLNPAAGETCDVGSPGPADCCTLCVYSAAGAACEDGLECTYADTCDGAGSCVPGGPAPCIGGFAKATMLINERIPVRKIVKVTLKKGPLLTKADFGDPSWNGGTSYRLCFFDDLDDYVGELEVGATGGSCGNQPCWVERTNAWHYRRKVVPNLKRLKLNGGAAGKSAVQYVNTKTDEPIGLAAGLAAAGGAKLQVRSSDAVCVEATVDQIKKQEPDFFKAVRK